MNNSNAHSSPRPSALSPVFAFPIRIYWEDTDAGGVVYYANYLRFFERARTEWLRSLGIDQSQVRDKLGVVFVVRDVHVEYLAPARLDDALDTTIDAVERRSASMTFAQRILRHGDGAVLVAARVRVACVAAADFKPQRIPESLGKLCAGAELPRAKDGPP
ncbi:MAG: tol-pal system-associated acyl-CoA thioesterase [Proteobacteria bacterium]|uniref:tol-pal system-associated acyl-CoA thioesterase n=1 Tax=Rudaea sp. TaxID=2136325 RepID=UPI00321FDD7C|nr:tol-pal system-associated acyl-CoA thioesterase [Pseudomonadota bacterium]